MASNSKLTASQKSIRKNMKVWLKEQGGSLHSFPSYGVTMVYVPAFEGARGAFMSVSMASNDEQKFRRKVGEYHALIKWEGGEVVPVPNVTFPANMLEEFAATYQAHSDSDFQGDDGIDW